MNPNIQKENKKIRVPKQNLLIITPNGLNSLVKYTYEQLRCRGKINASLLTASKVCTYKRVDLFRAGSPSDYDDS